VTGHLSNRPRSVVFLGTAHDNGGSSVLAGNVAEAMRLCGHHVEEWYLFGSTATITSPDARIFLDGPRKSSPAVLAALFVRVIAALRARKPDAVFGLQSLSNLLAGVGGRIAGIGNRIATYHQPRERQNRALMVLDAIVSRFGGYTKMVACGESVAETYRRASSAYAGLTVVKNGQKVPRAYPRDEARAALDLPASGAVLGQIGRFDNQKNQSFALDLIKDLPDTSLLLVGAGPNEASIMAAIAANGLADRVHTVRSIAHDRIGLFYSAVDAVLFPSRYEGLSLAAIEAMHAGVPLICSDIASFRELFRGSPLLSDTLLAGLGERERWLAAIRAMLSDQPLRRRVTAELARLAPTYGFDAMAQQYLRLVD